MTSSGPVQCASSAELAATYKILYQLETNLSCDIFCVMLIERVDSHHNAAAGLGGFRLTGGPTFNELLQFWTEASARATDARPLLLIHDPGQAFYQSNNAIGALSFDHELPAPAYVAAIKALVDPHVGTETFEGEALPMDEAEVDLINVNRDASMIVHDQALCMLVPVDEQRDAFYGCPQALRSDAAGFALVLSVIDRFRAEFAYDLVGIDSTYIYLIRDEALSDGLASTVAAAAGEAHRNFDRDQHRRLARAIYGSRSLVLTFRCM